jgi:twinkle protein
MIEERAKALDEARRLRLISAKEIDVDKYIKTTDVTHQVHEPSVWLEEMAENFGSPARTESLSYLCWPSSTGDFQFRPGEITIYAGTNGGGKSLVTGQIALGLIQQGRKVCIASFEMKPMQTLYRMLRQFSGINFESPFSRVTKSDFLKIVDRFYEFSDKKLWLYDQQGTTNAQQVIAMARFCAVELGVQHVFIDSLMKCVAAEDAYNEQKYFIDELCALARDHQIHVHLVHHIRKLSNEENMPSKTDIKGTGAIADQVDNVFLVYRNKKKEHDIQSGKDVDPATPDLVLMCEKQRNGEFEGWFPMWYHKDSQQFVDRFGGVAMAFDFKGDF